MKRIFVLISGMILGISLTNIHAQNNQKSVAVTIYNSNLGVVKDIREVDLIKGINSVKITDVASMLDPTSVLIKLNANVLEQNYQYDLVNLEKVLQKYIDKEINIAMKDGKTVSGILLSANNMQAVLQQKSGGILMIPNIYDAQISVPDLPEGLITRPTLVWTIGSENAGKQTAELSYQTSGMTWSAEYVAELNSDDTKMNLNSWVTVTNNSGATYKDAQLKLIAGEVNRVPINQPKMYKDFATVDIQSRASREGGYSGGFEEKEFFEYHLYDLQRKTTLSNNESKQISLFSVNDIKVDMKYRIIAGGNYSGGDAVKRDVNVMAEFKNSKDNNLGIPMPQGRIRLNKSDDKTLEFIGEDKINHTPKDELIKLKIGKAFDIIVEESLIDKKQIDEKTNEYEYEFYTRNRKSNKNVELNFENFIAYNTTKWENWEILKLDYKWEKKDANTITYKVPLKAGEEKKFKLRIRTTKIDKK